MVSDVHRASHHLVGLARAMLGLAAYRTMAMPKGRRQGPGGTSQGTMDDDHDPNHPTMPGRWNRRGTMESDDGREFRGDGLSFV